MPPFAFDVTETEFQSSVVDRSHQVPVVVDFWASWCGPCRVLGPVLEALAEHAAGRWLLAKVDVDSNPALSSQFGIQGIPAVKAFVDGRVAAEFVGARSRPEVEKWLEQLGPSPADVWVRQARDLLQEGDTDGARDLLTRALREDPDNLVGLTILGQLHADAADRDSFEALLARMSPRTRQTLSANFAPLTFRLQADGLGVADWRTRVVSDGTDLESRYRLGMALAAEGKIEDALEIWLDIVREDRSFRDDGARKAMIMAFEVLGPGSVESNAWRSRLASTLY